MQVNVYAATLRVRFIIFDIQVIITSHCLISIIGNFHDFYINEKLKKKKRERLNTSFTGF